MYIQHSSKFYTLKINYLESSAFNDFWRQLQIGLNKQNIPVFDKVKTTHKYKRPKDSQKQKASRHKILRLQKIIIKKKTDLLNQSNDLRQYTNSSFLPTTSQNIADLIIML